MTLHEQFWTHASFAFVGDAARKSFPSLSYAQAKQLGKRVFPVDPSLQEVGGDRVYRDLAALPEPVEAVVLEVPREDTAAWVRRAAEAGIRNVWIHQKRETPEALEIAARNRMNVLTGTCAVMYLVPGLSFHSIHRWVMKLAGKY